MCSRPTCGACGSTIQRWWWDGKTARPASESPFSGQGGTRLLVTEGEGADQASVLERDEHTHQRCAAAQKRREGAQ